MRLNSKKCTFRGQGWYVLGIIAHREIDSSKSRQMWHHLQYGDSFYKRNNHEDQHYNHLLEHTISKFSYHTLSFYKLLRYEVHFEACFVQPFDLVNTHRQRDLIHILRSLTIRKKCNSHERGKHQSHYNPFHLQGVSSSTTRCQKIESSTLLW